VNPELGAYPDLSAETVSFRAGASVLTADWQGSFRATWPHSRRRGRSIEAKPSQIVNEPSERPQSIAKVVRKLNISAHNAKHGCLCGYQPALADIEVSSAVGYAG
jgi:hypothetical protein